LTVLACLAPPATSRSQADDGEYFSEAATSATFNVDMARMVSRKAVSEAQEIDVRRLSEHGGNCCRVHSCCYPSGWDVGAELALLKMHITRDPGVVSQDNGAGGTYSVQP